MKSCLRILPVLFFLTSLILAGCEGDEGTGPVEPTTVEGWISQGWAQYGAADYEGSANSFENAAQLAEALFWEAYEDSVYAAAINDSVGVQEAMENMAAQVVYLTESLTGIGWNLIELAESATGAYVFTSALELNPIYEDAIAGYAFLLQAMEQWQQSNERTDQLLALNPTWFFIHDQTINYLDLQLTRAKNNFFLCEFEVSQEEALELAAGFGYDTDLELAALIGLPTFSYNLATIEGRSALLMLIDALEDLI